MILHRLRDGLGLGIVLAFWSPPVEAAEPAPAAGPYHLLHPVPADQMRELDTDRPDQTESPITVDAGHFQLEADLVSYTRTDAQGITLEEVSAPVLNLKAGLLPNLDLQVVLSPYNRVRVTDRTRPRRTTETASGFGDTDVRLKLNVWGNDGGPSALAVMPFIQIPTGEDGLGSGEPEGGLIVPFGFDLPGGFEAGMMWEADFRRDLGSPGHHAEFIQSIAVGRDLVGPLSAYVEFFSAVSTEEGRDWVGQFDLGFNYLATRNLKFDAGVNIGVTKAAPDWNPFLGVTWRW